MLLHAFVPATRANGPGLRAAIYFQGCTLNCSNCWNKTTHKLEGQDVAVRDVAQRFEEARRLEMLEGVTFSGGEPMQQAGDIAELLRGVCSTLPTLSIGMFTGYSEKELETGHYFTRHGIDRDRRRTLWRSIRGQLDFAVMGRFNRHQPSDAPMRTSANQALRLFSGRYSEGDFYEQTVEITIAADGLARTTGFPTLGNPA